MKNNETHFANSEGSRDGFLVNEANLNEGSLKEDIIKRSNKLYDPFNFSSELKKVSECTFFSKKIIEHSNLFRAVITSFELLFFKLSADKCISCNNSHYTNGMYLTVNEKDFPICMSCYLIGCTISKKKVGEDISISCFEHKPNNIFLSFEKLQVENQKADDKEKILSLLLIYYSYRFMLQCILFATIEPLKDYIEYSRLGQKIKEIENNNEKKDAIELAKRTMSQISSKYTNYIPYMKQMHDLFNEDSSSCEKFDLRTLGFNIKKANFVSQFYNSVVSLPLRSGNTIAPSLGLVVEMIELLGKAVKNGANVWDFSMVMLKFGESVKLDIEKEEINKLIGLSQGWLVQVQKNIIEVDTTKQKVLQEFNAAMLNNKEKKFSEGDMNEVHRIFTETLFNVIIGNDDNLNFSKDDGDRIKEISKRNYSSIEDVEKLKEELNDTINKLTKGLERSNKEYLSGEFWGYISSNINGLVEDIDLESLVKLKIQSK